MNTIHPLGLSSVLLVSVLISSPVTGQKKIPYINSADSINLGISYADTGAYLRASALYESVSPNDTNYALALLDDAVAKESSEQDSDAIIICQKGLEQECDYHPDFYNTLANVYMDEGDYADAIKLLQDSVLPKYSNIHKLYFTLGMAQYKMHKYSDAINSFEKSINLDIYDALSHYYLGRCCLEQGRLVPALLSLQFYLVLQPQTNRSYTAIGLIEQMTGNKYQYNKSYMADPAEYHDSAFTELDLLIRSKIALNRQYAAATKINYNFVKQIQLFLEQLKYIPNTGNYWMDEYVPFFSGLQQKKYLEPYMYFIMSTVNDQTLQKGIVKDKKKIKEFAKWADGILTAQRSKKEIDLGGKKTSVNCYYFDNNMVQSMGPETAPGKPTGEWTFFYSHSGRVYSHGNYNNTGEREGKWEWFYSTGILKETISFSNGKREGTAEVWHENGAPKAKYTFHNDLLDGECWEYNVSGILTTNSNYKEDKLTGTATYFYNDGKQHYLANYTNGKFEGELKEYYVTGQLMSVKAMQNDVKNGSYTSYWSNGKTQETGEYKDDKQFGHWKIYYKDGSLQKEGDFNLKGNPVGRWVFYYRNGKMQEVDPYNSNGESEGMDTIFDKDGKEYKELFYKNDVLVNYTFKDKDGKIIKAGKIEGKNLPLVSYSPEGVKNHEGLYVNNVKEGEWKYYNYFGVLASKESYSNGKLSGIAIDYFSNSKVKDSVNYTNDVKDGYYVSYHINGMMDTQGWYVNGDKQGDWYYYDLKGNLIKHNFYVNGSLHGYSDFFEPGGPLLEKQFYRYGYLDKIFDYDTSGIRVEYKYISDNGNGKYICPYNNGNIIHEINYVNGYNDGPVKRYFYNGQLSYEGEYLLDNLQGTSKAYFDNGNVRSIYTYDLGNCEGTGNSYFKNGNLDETGKYYDDNLEGEYKYYYENGKLSAIGHDDEGEDEGEYKCYYGDSNVRGIFWFHEGNIIAYASADKEGKALQKVSIDKGNGAVTCYYPDGNKSIQCQYVDGYLDGKRINYTPDGKLHAEENFESGYRNGIQKYYFEGDTAMKEEDNYYYGELDGICRYYYKNGKVEHEESYILGTREGPSRYYDKSGNLVKTVVYYNGNEISETAAK